MSKCIYGNTVGAGGGLPKSYVLETEDGTQKLIGVLVGEETVLTATDNDVRENLIYAGEKGLSSGTKVIPSYFVNEGFRAVPNGRPFQIPVDEYDYTKLQAIICPFNTTLDNSVAAEQVVINDNVYNVQSTVAISTVNKDISTSSVDLGITNVSGKLCLIRYFIYKEIY